MKIGALVDLHGTLLQSNLAWIEAFSRLDPNKREFYTEQIMLKRSRHELADLIGISFKKVENLYHQNLIPRFEVVEMVITLSKHYPLVLVSNGPEYRVMRDLKRVPHLKFDKIYTASDGLKSDIKYLERILDEQGWSKGLLVGNDLEEDFLESERIIPVLVPDKPRWRYFGIKKEQC
jgi:FMN phosphatase YigB (HAD superfamily)